MAAVPARYAAGCPAAATFLSPGMTPLAASGVLARRYGNCRRLQASGTTWTKAYLADLGGHARNVYAKAAGKK